jgi:hypothetical protein
MIGSRQRRNDQRIDAGGGKRDRADQPSRPGADNRDFSGEGGIHTDSATRAAHPHPNRKRMIANNLDAVFNLTCKLATWIPILPTNRKIRRAAPPLSPCMCLPPAAPAAPCWR